MVDAKVFFASQANADPDKDRVPIHLIEGDIGRIYRLLVSEWLVYMQYLKNNHPYLFSLAMRLNPFDPAATAVVEDR